MTVLTKPGDFCPNEKCPKDQKLEDHPATPNIIQAGQTKAGVYWYECKPAIRHLQKPKAAYFIESKPQALT